MAIKKNLKIKVGNYLLKHNKEMLVSIAKHGNKKIEEFLMSEFSDDIKSATIVFKRVFNASKEVRFHKVKTDLTSTAIAQAIFSNTDNQKEWSSYHIDKILESADPGEKGRLVSIMKWRIPRDDLEESITLLRDKTPKALIELINFDEELRLLIFQNTLLSEGYLNTSIWNLNIGEYDISEIPDNYIYDIPQHKRFVKKFINLKTSEERKVKSILKNFTFGQKIHFFSNIHNNMAKNHLSKNQRDELKMTEIVDSLFAWNRIRNRSTHDPIVATQNFITQLDIVTNPENKLTKEQQVILRLDTFPSAIGFKNYFKNSLSTLFAKYKDYIDCDQIVNLNFQFSQ